MVKARERVRAIRTVGVTLAVAGGLLLGVGFATPALRQRRRHHRPAARRRGRRVHRGARRPAGRRRSGVLRVRPRSSRWHPGTTAATCATGSSGCEAWFAEKRTQPRWRFAGGFGAHGARAARRSPSRATMFRTVLLVVARARALRGHRGLPAGGGTARHRPHDPEAAQAPGGRRVRRRSSPRPSFTAFVAVGIVANNTTQATREPHQPGVQRLHRAVPAAAEPDRVAGEPQRDVVGGVRLPRRRAHHHHPRAAQRAAPGSS